LHFKVEVHIGKSVYTESCSMMINKPQFNRQQPVAAYRPMHTCLLGCLSLFLSLLPVLLQAQNSDDVALAESLSKKYKEDKVVAVSSYRYFTFDKGKNALGDNVVEIQEDAEYEFLSLKKYASMTFPEFYNKFIELKTFKRAFKSGKKYILSERAGIDRSITDDGIFFDDSRVQFYPIRFSQKGDMARITVMKKYTDGKYLTRLFFNAPYPVKEQVIEFKVPEWLKVDFKRMNFEGNTIEVKETKKGDFTHFVFIMRDVPADKDEVAQIGKGFTDPHIIVQLKSSDYKGTVFKGFDKIDDVYNWNNRLYTMAGNDKSKLTAQVSKLTEGKANDIEKIKSIYYWIQDNIRYIAYEDGYSGYIPASVQDVLTKKYGDCKGMANLLTEMLKIAGFDAHFAWIGTRHIPYLQSMPALCVNNHAICVLNYKDKTYYLDGTENYIPLGENAFRIQGKEVMIANGDKFDITTVPQPAAGDDKLQTKADFILAGEKLSGKVKVILTGNQRTDFHQSYQNVPLTTQKEFLNDFLEFGNTNMIATNLKTSDLVNRDIPVTIEGDVDLSNTVNTINTVKYVGIDFFPKTLDKFIPDEKRVQGYDLDVVVKFEDEISLTVPADKKFIDKPDNLEIKHDGYEFKGTYTIEGNKLVLRKELSIRNSLIRKSEFPAWKKFIESIKEFNSYLVSISNK
jgi:hypothetical protein